MVQRVRHANAVCAVYATATRRERGLTWGPTPALPLQVHAELLPERAAACPTAAHAGASVASARHFAKGAAEKRRTRFPPPCSAAGPNTVKQAVTGCANSRARACAEQRRCFSGRALGQGAAVAVPRSCPPHRSRGLQSTRPIRRPLQGRRTGRVARVGRASHREPRREGLPGRACATPSGRAHPSHGVLRTRPECQPGACDESGRRIQSPRPDALLRIAGQFSGWLNCGGGTARAADRCNAPRLPSRCNAAGTGSCKALQPSALARTDETPLRRKRRSFAPTRGGPRRRRPRSARGLSTHARPRFARCPTFSATGAQEPLLLQLPSDASSHTVTHVQADTGPRPQGPSTLCQRRPGAR